MFEHLDDPVAYEPGPDALATVMRAGTRRHRRRVLATTSVAVVLTLVCGVAAALAYVGREVHDIDRVHVAGLPPAPGPGRPFTVLFVGVDASQALDPAASRPGVSGQRSDTMVVARIDPSSNTIRTLALYRDLWGTLPDQASGKLNQAIEQGGASALIATLRDRYGIAVDRYVQLDFTGAEAMAGAVGGLRIATFAPVRDLNTGLDVARAACRTYRGADALALARSRHWQALVHGRWVADPMSDLGRVRRQEVVGQAALDALSRFDTADPRRLNQLLDVFVHHATLDDKTTVAQLVQLARSLHGATIDPTFPAVRDVVIDGQDALELAPAGRRQVASFVRGDTSPSAGGPYVPPGPFDIAAC